MGLRTQAASLTAGTAGRVSGRSDHHSSPDAAVLPSTTATPFGHAAPASIHWRRKATASGVSFGPSFGIFASGPLTIRTSRLSPAAPAFTTGPESPPRRSPLAVVRSRPPRFFAGLWQPAKRAPSSGATWSANRSGSAARAAAVAGATRPDPAGLRPTGSSWRVLLGSGGKRV